MRVFIFLMAACLILSGCTGANKVRSMEITDSSVSIGAVNSDLEDSDTQRLTYDITMTNTEGIRIVDEADILFTKPLKDRIIEVQREGMQYDEGTIRISGEVIFDSRGLTKEEISEYEPYIRSVQFIGDDNKKYFLEYPSGK